MKNRIDRRQLLAAGAAFALVPAAARAAQEKPADTFSFPLLGDLHYDRLSHHEMEWLKREKPNDVHQVQDYSRLTEAVLPRLFPEIREEVTGGKSSFVVHVGDFVEGLCGTSALAARQCEEAIRFVREANLGAPFLFTKGNHDITGPGAVEAFDSKLRPFLAEQAQQELTSASYAIERGSSLFVYYDCYRAESLEWLEKTLKGRSARHLFLVIHQPVVPFGARSTWAVFTKPQQAAQRKRLLGLLGHHRAIVLCGHIHKFGTVVRRTEEGPFVQLMVSSVISKPDAAPKDHVEGVGQYGPDNVRLEPSFSPETEAERRELLAAEVPSIRQFEYADAPGYALLRAEGSRVTARVFNGVGRRYWKTLDLTALLDA